MDKVFITNYCTKSTRIVLSTFRMNFGVREEETWEVSGTRE